MKLKAFLGIGLLSMLFLVCAGPAFAVTAGLIDLNGDATVEDGIKTGSGGVAAASTDADGNPTFASGSAGTATAVVIGTSNAAYANKTLTLTSIGNSGATLATIYVGTDSTAADYLATAPFNLKVGGAVAGAATLAVTTGGVARNVEFLGLVTAKAVDVLGGTSGNTLALNSYKMVEDDSTLTAKTSAGGKAILNLGSVARSTDTTKTLSFVFDMASAADTAEINIAQAGELVLGAGAVADKLTFDTDGDFTKQLFSVGGALTIEGAETVTSNAADATIRTGGTFTADFANTLALGRVQNTSGGIVLTATAATKTVSLAESSAGTALTVNGLAAGANGTTLTIKEDVTLTVGTYTPGEAGA